MGVDRLTPRAVNSLPDTLGNGNSMKSCPSIFFCRAVLGFCVLNCAAATEVQFLSFGDQRCCLKAGHRERLFQSPLILTELRPYGIVHGQEMLAIESVSSIASPLDVGRRSRTKYAYYAHMLSTR